MRRTPFHAQIARAFCALKPSRLPSPVFYLYFQVEPPDCGRGVSFREFHFGGVDTALAQFVGHGAEQQLNAGEVSEACFVGSASACRAMV
jgi:hypothetical protein